jgi:hypothetical protein
LDQANLPTAVSSLLRHSVPTAATLDVLAVFDVRKTGRHFLCANRVIAGGY